MRTDPEDLEELAALEHERWRGQARCMLSAIETLETIIVHEIVDGQAAPHGFLGVIEHVAHWDRRSRQTYAELHDVEREICRAEVRARLDAYRPADTGSDFARALARRLTEQGAAERDPA